MNLQKILALVMAVVIILNFVLFAIKILTIATFWLVIILSAITAYWIIPKLAKRTENRKL